MKINRKYKENGEILTINFNKKRRISNTNTYKRDMSLILKKIIKKRTTQTAPWRYYFCRHGDYLSVFIQRTQIIESSFNSIC